MRILFFMLLLIMSTPSYAEWPEHTVKFIVPLGAGSGADIGARMFVDRLSARWKQPIVVENKPGGDSIIAIQSMLSSNDDHTFLYIPAGNFTVHPFIYKNLPYNPNDLVPIVQTSNTILGIALSKNSPYNNLKEFTEAARANPGKFNSAVVPGLTEFVFSSYVYKEKLVITKISYRDINQGFIDLAEGRVDIAMGSIAQLGPLWSAGKIKVIALTNQNRTSLVPGIPTAKEEGFDSLVFEGLHGIVGSKNVSKEIREQMLIDFKSAADKEMEVKFASIGHVMNIQDSRVFSQAIKDQKEKIEYIIKNTGYEPKN